MLAEEVVANALLLKRAVVAEVEGDHAADLLAEAGRLFERFGIGKHPETDETAIKFADRWYTAAQWGKGLGTRDILKTKSRPANTEFARPPDAEPKYLKDLTLKLAYGDAHIPFQIWAGTDGAYYALPLAENAGGQSYKLDIEGDGSLEWPMLRGLEGGGKKGPFELGDYDLIGYLIREARGIEMERLNSLGTIDGNGELYEVPEFQPVDGDTVSGTRTLRPGEGHRHPRLGKEVSIASRAEWWEQYNRVWSEGEPEVPIKFADGRIESALASEIS